ncbi:hypothetical protein MIR68_011242 [Amoeboaphelidium protococcarum]|nr:hypothetical protein MIR68_011242 [Amoeboaphelidium protococcarum]
MVAKKHKSKRQSAGMKYKIQKKVRDHHKKLKKDAKKNPQIRRKPKQIGIPNSLPFKDAILRQVEEAKQEKQQERDAQRKASQERKQLKKSAVKADLKASVEDQ